MQKHPFHLVDSCFTPILGAFGAFCSTSGGVAYFQGYADGGITMAFGQVILLYTMFIWFRDIIREATYEGHHTKQVQTTHTIGMILFIVSEIMFFVSFFWAFFHSSLAPTIEIGAVWPPVGISILDAWHIPFLNTLILLSSGATITWTHHCVLAGARKQAILSLIATVGLGAIFTLFQIKEYLDAPFSINDSVYGSTFFMCTGFHVLVGSVFLLVCLARLIQFHFNKFHHFGFEAAAMYWHFVDVVWLFLFACIYWWGGN
jgi:cytochrome c oxidase subunit 3